MHVPASPLPLHTSRLPALFFLCQPTAVVVGCRRRLQPRSRQPLLFPAAIDHEPRRRCPLPSLPAVVLSLLQPHFFLCRSRTTLLSLSFPRCSGAGHIAAPAALASTSTTILFLNRVIPSAVVAASVADHATRIAATQKPSASSTTTTSLLPCILLCCRRQRPLPCSLAAAAAALQQGSATPPEPSLAVHNSVLLHITATSYSKAAPPLSRCPLPLLQPSTTVFSDRCHHRFLLSTGSDNSRSLVLDSLGSLQPPSLPTSTLSLSSSCHASSSSTLVVASVINAVAYFSILAPVTHPLHQLWLLLPSSTLLPPPPLLFALYRRCRF
ncbi:hypothetical protein BHE74_00049431 [Ensete ventricosum]|nr:hypothetical protein BHE74_00049431 [Ensete ventricosum]